MNTNKTELLNLLKRSNAKFSPIINRFYPFSEEQLLKYKDKLWWAFISENKNIKWTPQLISQYKDLFAWEDRIWKNPSLPISIDFIENNNYTVNYYDLPLNKGTHWSDEFILHFKDKWNWHYILLNESINWTKELFIKLDLFDKRISILNGQNLWTEDFILQNMNKFDWWHLSYNPYLPWSIELIEKLKPIWTSSFFLGLSFNKGVPWSVEIIKKYADDYLGKKDGFKWSGLSLNESLPWNEEFVKRFENNWEWDGLSGNNKIAFNLVQIEKYKDKFLWKRNHPNFGALSDNTSLPWSEELIDAYLEKWDWEGLSENEGIQWNEKMINKYRGKLNLNELFWNPGLPWSLEFLLKFENDFLKAWKMDNHTEKCKQVIWDKVFSNVLDDEMIETLLN